MFFFQLWLTGNVVSVVFSISVCWEWACCLVGLVSAHVGCLEGGMNREWWVMSIEGSMSVKDSIDENSCHL